MTPHFELTVETLEEGMVEEGSHSDSGAEDRLYFEPPLQRWQGAPSSPLRRAALGGLLLGLGAVAAAGGAGQSTPMEEAL